MKSLSILILGLILASGSSKGLATTLDSWRNSPELLRATAELRDNQMEELRPSLMERSGRDANGTDDSDTLREMSRLFGDPLSRNEPDLRRLAEKALLALPLLGRANGVQLFLRPQNDLVSTFAKRLTLWQLRNSPPITPPPGAIAIDTHIHTCYSADSLADVSQQLTTAAKRGLTGIAITDHNSLGGVEKAERILGAMKRQHKLPEEFFVIRGEEISSSEGHIIALYISRVIPAGMNAEQTIEAIHAQGGLAVAAHPCWQKSLAGLANTLPFDAVETENGSEELKAAVSKGGFRERRATFYATVTKPRLGGSDAHDPEMVGICYTRINCAPTPEAVRAAILAGQSQAVSGLTRHDEKQLVRRGIAGLVVSLGGALDQGLTFRTKTANISLWPRPEIFWSFRR